MVILLEKVMVLDDSNDDNISNNKYGDDDIVDNGDGASEQLLYSW